MRNCIGGGGLLSPGQQDPLKRVVESGLGSGGWIKDLRGWLWGSFGRFSVLEAGFLAKGPPWSRLRYQRKITYPEGGRGEIAGNLSNS